MRKAPFLLHLFLILSAASQLSACEGPVSQRAAIPPIDGVGTGPVDTLPTYESETHRGRKRLDVDQLNGSIRRVAGRAWMSIGGEDILESVARTLGRPDFANSTLEDLTHGPLFERFLGDASKQVCAEMIRVEPNMAASDRVLLHDIDLGVSPVSSAERERIVRELVMRFHGNELDDAALARWLALYQSATQLSGGDIARAHGTLCMTLFTHPDFYTY